MGLWDSPSTSNLDPNDASAPGAGDQAAPAPTQLWSVTSRAHPSGWAARNPLWASLDGPHRVAAMAMMEANPGPNYATDTQDVAGAIVNNAGRLGQDLGEHVSQSHLYQPLIEWNQEQRLPMLLKSPQYAELADWVSRRALGQEPDPVGGATNYLAHAGAMLALYNRDPYKYPISHWGAWTGFNGHDYTRKTAQDSSHAFIVPVGEEAFSVPYTPPQTDMGNIADNSPSMNSAMASVGADTSQLPDLGKTNVAQTALPASASADQSIAASPSQNVAQTVAQPAQTVAQNDATSAMAPASVNSSQDANGASTASTPQFPGMMSLGGPKDMADDTPQWDSAFNAALPYRPIGPNAAQIAQNAVITAKGGGPLVSQTGPSVPSAPGSPPVIGGVTPDMEAALKGPISTNRAKMLAEAMDKMAYGPSASRTAFSPIEGLSRAVAAGVGGYEGAQADKQELAQKEAMVKLLQGGDPYQNMLSLTAANSPEKLPEVLALVQHNQQWRGLMDAYARAHGLPSPGQQTVGAPGNAAPPVSIPGTSIGSMPQPSAQTQASPAGAPVAAPGPAAASMPPSAPAPSMPTPAGAGFASAIQGFAPGPNINSGTAGNVINNADPMTMMELGMMGPEKGGETLLTETNKANIANASQAGENYRKFLELNTIPRDFNYTDANGMGHKAQIPAGGVAQFLAANPGVQPGIMDPNPGQRIGMEDVAKRGAEYSQEGIQAQKDRVDLERMDSLRKAFNPGLFSEPYYFAAKAGQALFGSDFMKNHAPAGMSPEATAAYQEFDKLATSFSANQTRGMGAREAASVFNVIRMANPNANMTQEALGGVLAGLQATNEYLTDRGQAATQWYATHGNSYEGFENAWMSSHPVEGYLLNHMTPELAKNLPPETFEKMKALRAQQLAAQQAAAGQRPAAGAQ